MGGIGTSLGIGVLIGDVTSIPSPVAIVGLGAVAIGLIAHALFLNGPVGDIDDLTEEVAIVEVPMVLSPMESAD
ncbi:hypothetical protein [Natrinema halophilum]|uniref:hypothetical protein n=1 Tax=Natrinema halophilum TaxID=1699371 RepID=UPI001F462984|nr:hypothetical protein [Natrinema halophilum]QLG51229.2 hypothetical protein HYG82_13990 [Natrinema halophilum]